MHCQQANEFFSDYIERALDPAMTVSVDNHLAACPACREEMVALRLVWTQLDQVAYVEPPARLHAGIMHALEAHLEAEHARFRAPGQERGVESGQSARRYSGPEPWPTPPPRLFLL